jgi:hypothetical protein
VVLWGGGKGSLRLQWQQEEVSSSVAALSRPLRWRRDEPPLPLQERRQGPMAGHCADGQRSGPSAQDVPGIGSEEGRRRSTAVGTARRIATATVGTRTAVGRYGGKP